MPNVWDDTKVIDGKIGECAAVARRSGDDWFVGTINGSEADRPFGSPQAKE